MIANASFPVCVAITGFVCSTGICISGNNSCRPSLNSCANSFASACEMPICRTFGNSFSSFFKLLNRLSNVYFPRPFVTGINSEWAKFITTRMFKTLDSKPVFRLILPPFTKLSSVDIPMYNFV